MKRLAAVVMSTAFVVMGLASPAAAQTAGNQRFIVYGSGSGNQASFSVVAIGPITGFGTFEETEDPDVVRFRFPQGTITLFSPTGDETEDFDERTCTGSFTFTGPVTIVGATGAFTGTTGTGTVRGQGYFVGERTATGCSEDEDSGFFFLYADVRANVTRAGQAAA
jgi:hypothetical protein